MPVRVRLAPPVDVREAFVARDFAFGFEHLKVLGRRGSRRSQVVGDLESKHVLPLLQELENHHLLLVHMVPPIR